MIRSSASTPASIARQSPESVGQVLIPLRFLTDLLPHLTDFTELQVTMAVFRIAGTGGHEPAAASERSILEDKVLAGTFAASAATNDFVTRVRRGLQYATARGSVVPVMISSQTGSELWYIPETGETRRDLQEMRSTGDLSAGRFEQSGASYEIEIVRPSLFTVYERNIGLLTPLLADQIAAAMDIYPIDWIEDAIGEAVSYNRRNWRYIQRILENWATSDRGASPQGGKSHEAHRRGSDELLDPDQYREGRHLRRARKF